MKNDIEELLQTIKVPRLELRHLPGCHTRINFRYVFWYVVYRYSPLGLYLYMLLAERTGLEPATLGVTGRYSNQLNYRSVYSIMLVIA